MSQRKTFAFDIERNDDGIMVVTATMAKKIPQVHKHAHNNNRKNKHAVTKHPICA